ncbi:MAG: hypothetical protein DRO23_09415 [Thermoprotei archaeon]|nr:MAG: hypothetical protein DRO23_09415 [Thermoprotei archaeon]
MAKIFGQKERNTDSIKFEKIRKNIDKKYEDLHDELSDAYYNYWREGASKEWQGHDVQPTLEESKVLFDKLHGLIFLVRDIEFDEENSKLEDDDSGKKKIDSMYEERLDSVKNNIKKLKDEGIEITL